MGGWEILQVRVPSLLKEKFEAICKKTGQTMTEVIINLVTQFVKKNS